MQALAPSRSTLTAPAYLDKYGLRETLEELVNDVLKQKPADPYEAMAASLRAKPQPTPSVMDALWPEVGPIDALIMRSAKYLDDTMHAARLRMAQGPQTGSKKKKGKKAAAGPPPKCLALKLVIAVEYPESSQKVLKFLQTHYDEVRRCC